MARFTAARIRYHGAKNAASADRMPEDGRSHERQSSSLDDGSVIQDSESANPLHSQVKEKLGPDAGDGRKPPRKTGWRPVALRRTSLAAFVVVFCSMLAALEIIKQYSDHHQGLASTVQGRHYLWTYGPTASENLHPLRSSASLTCHSLHFARGLLATHRIQGYSDSTMAADVPW